jgi:hypothetical protein
MNPIISTANKKFISVTEAEKIILSLQKDFGTEIIFFMMQQEEF